MRTGYGLHADRLSFSRKPAIRSVKFPLEVKDQKVFDDFCGKIQHDYINCVGDINLADWYENEYLVKKPTYSVFDFWLDSLRAGFIFAPSPKKLKRILKVFSSTDEDTKDKTFFNRLSIKSPRLYKLITKRENFIKAFAIPNEIRKNKTLNTITSLLLSCTSEDVEGEDKIFLEDCAKKIFDGTHGKQGDDQRTFLQKEFGIDKSLYKTGKRKFTTYPVPSLGFLGESVQKGARNARALLSRVEKDIGSKIKEKRDLQDLLGADNSITALSNFLNVFLFDLRKGEKTEEIYQDFLSFAPIWKGKENELKKRLLWLREKALKLAEYPELATDWSQFRSNVGGKIKSWVTSYLNQKVKITGKGKVDKKGEKEEGEIEVHKRDIEKALNKKVEMDAIGMVGEDFIDGELRNKLLKLQKILGQVYNAQTDNLDGDKLEIYRIELADARFKLNELYHERYPDYDYEEKGSGDKKPRKKDNKQISEKRAEKDLPNLFKDIKQLPEFVGDAKKKRFVEFMDAPNVLNACIEKLKAFETARTGWATRQFSGEKNKKYVKGDIDYAKDILEKLRQKYYGNGSVSGLNGTRFKHIIENLFSKFELSIALEREYPLFKHPSLRHNVQVFSSPVLINLTAKRAGELLEDFVNRSPRWDEFSKKEDIADALWFEKIRVGVVLDSVNKEQFSLSDIGGFKEKEKERLKELCTFLDLLKTRSFTKDQFRGILQNYILSVAAGRFGVLTREKYVERYCVQPMNTEQHYPLFYRKSDKGKKEWGILFGTDEKYTKKETKVRQVGVSVHVIKGKDFSEEKNHRLEQYKSDSQFAMLKTSPYQTQFITKAFGCDGKESWYSRKDLSTSISSYSFIVEEPVRLDWNIMEKRVSLKRSGEKKLFVSIPFNLESMNTLEKAKLDAQYKNRKRVMGIDTGEYGLAYVILDKEKMGEEFVIAKGFIQSNLIYKIREFIGTLKSRQIRGTFGIPSTKLARIRENAITSLRNQVSAIALQYGAMPVYEGEISAFEIGSGKIKKIYNSVKEADVSTKKSPTAEAEHVLVWGDKFHQFGAETSARATSYICMNTKCGCYCPYEEYKQDDKRQSEELKREKGESRPSLVQFKKYAEYKQFNPSKLEEYCEQRGNSAIYVCHSCRNVTDADIQAAYWIGVRRIKSEMMNRNRAKEEKWQTATVPDIIAFHNEKGTPPFQLLEG